MPELKEHRKWHRWDKPRQKTAQVIEIVCKDCRLRILGSIPIDKRRCEFKYKDGDINESLEAFAFYD